MSLLDTASLIVTPNGYKEGKLYSVIPSDGSGDLSVTRATTATRVNSAGLVELVPYNILQRSQEFNNSTWWSTGTITPNATTAPDGTMTADRVQFSSGSSNYLYQGIGSAYDGKVVTISCYLKGVTAQNIGFSDGSAYPNQISITTEWQRYTFTFTFVGGGIQIDNYFGVSPSAQEKDFYIWGAQLVEGSVAKDYQKTETRLNIPRLDYSNGTCPSILVEPQRTNLLTYSENFSNAAWISGGGTITSNAAIAPNGTQTADEFSSGVYCLQGSIIGVSTVSVYFKKTTSNIAYIRMDAVNSIYIEYNINTGVVSSVPSGYTATIEDAGNGWFRCTATATSPSSNNIVLFIGPCLIWGAQLEAGSYATSYIPTTSASVTRNADVISKTGISSLIGQTEGVFYSEFTCDFKNPNGSIPIYLRGSGGGGSYSYSTYVQMGANNFNVLVFSNNVAQLSLNSGTLTDGQMVKMAFAYKANDFVLYINGVQTSFYNAGTPSIGLNALDFGSYFGAPGVFDYDGYIKSFALWKTRLTNAQLAQLTTI